MDTNKQDDWRQRCKERVQLRLTSFNQLFPEKSGPINHTKFMGGIVMISALTPCKHSPFSFLDDASYARLLAMCQVKLYLCNLMYIIAKRNAELCVYWRGNLIIFHPLPTVSTVANISSNLLQPGGASELPEASLRGRGGFSASGSCPLQFTFD